MRLHDVARVGATLGIAPAVLERPFTRPRRGLSAYLDLLLKWNARTNLTAIREPEEIVSRHFGESLFVAAHLPPGPHTLLDLGSGAGFPGIPAQMARPDLVVCLAESQNKKAAFLREACRVLNLSCEVWAARTESMPSTRRFDLVTLRAVDDPSVALAEAVRRAVPGGRIFHLTTANTPRSRPIRFRVEVILFFRLLLHEECSTWSILGLADGANCSTWNMLAQKL